jgi:hypothetical protein
MAVYIILSSLTCQEIKRIIFFFDTASNFCSRVRFISSQFDMNQLEDVPFS